MSRVIEESESVITLNEGNGYKLRATLQRVGTFSVVAVDWEHPNYGYFADAMMWYKSLHMADWDIIPIVKWSEGYEDGSGTHKLRAFLKDFPEFQRLFEVEHL